MNIFNKYSSRKPCYASIARQQIPTMAAQCAMQKTGNGLITYLGSQTNDTELTYMMNKFLQWVQTNFSIEKSNQNY